MKKCSVSLLSKAKILISVILAVTVVCTMAVSVLAANANEGYATANATVYTPMDLLSTTTATSTDSLILKDAQDSSVWKFAVNGVVLDTVEYVRPNMHKALNNYIKYSHSGDIFSTYAFYGNTNTYTDNTYKYTKRTIKFTVSNNEKMTFGFTAPSDGWYNISAPIEATGNNITYAVSKSDSSNNSKTLQDWNTYSTKGTLCNITVELKRGETVWLEVTADDGAIIDIGIPQARKHIENKGAIDNGDGTYTFNYRAMDYIEINAATGLTYGTFSSTTNSSGSWKYGYFKDTVTFGTKASEFTSALKLNATELAFDLDRATGFTNEFKSAMREYELIPYGDRLAAFDTSSTDATKNILGSSNAAVKAASGVIVPTSSTNEAFASYDIITSNFRAASENKVSTSYTQYGNWFEFTAPVSWDVTLTYPATNLDSKIVMLIAVNDKNVFRTFQTTTSDTSLQLGTLNEGDRVTVVYYAFKSTTKADIALPSVSITTLQLPEEPAEIDYDLDGDYDVDGADLEILRNYLLGLGTIDDDRLPFADKNGKEGIDIRDLVHIRALIAVS